MDLDTVIVLAGIAVSMTWTPGPNNMMLAASGANFGWGRTLPHAMGVAFGFPVMLVLVSLGLGPIFQADPLIGELLGWMGCAAMLWFAWKIATAEAANAQSTARPLTFVQACAFQWVNPKAWVFAIYVAANFASGASVALNIAVAALVFLLSGLGSSQSWTIFGAWMGQMLGRGWRLRTFNIVMAALLVGCAVWLLLDA